MASINRKASGRWEYLEDIARRLPDDWVLDAEWDNFYNTLGIMVTGRGWLHAISVDMQPSLTASEVADEFIAAGEDAGGMDLDH